jgi:hypothetical protein
VTLSDELRAYHRQVGTLTSYDDATRRAVLLDVRTRRHLQLAGSALLTFLGAEPGGWAREVEQVTDWLRVRRWPGDRELAELLVECTTPDVEPQLRRIRVDLDQVSDLLEAGPESAGGYLDLATGLTWTDFMLEDLADQPDTPDVESDPDRFIWVPSVGSSRRWRDMRDFAEEEVGDVRLCDQLLAAIQGRGAFRRFADVLERHEVLYTIWHAYSEEARVGRAREWLAGQGFDALPDVG